MHCNSYDELANHRAVFKVNDIVCNQSADRRGEKMHCGRYAKNRASQPEPYPPSPLQRERDAFWVVVHTPMTETLYAVTDPAPSTIERDPPYYYIYILYIIYL